MVFVTENPIKSLIDHPSAPAPTNPVAILKRISMDSPMINMSGKLVRVSREAASVQATSMAIQDARPTQKWRDLRRHPIYFQDLRGVYKSVLLLLLTRSSDLFHLSPFLLRDCK